MGLLGKVIKGTTSIIKGGSNKNDVKIAKLELEKAKIESKNQKKYDNNQNNDSQVEDNALEGILKFAKAQFEIISDTMLSLKSEIVMTLEKISIEKNNKLSFKEKGQLKKEKNEVERKLEYLYLSKDYLLFLTKYANGLSLDEEQSYLILKFYRFFDGVKVIDLEEQYGDDEDDDSIMGSFKEVVGEFKEVFYKSKKNIQKFSFIEYLEKYYSEEVSDLKVPKIDFVIDSFSKLQPSNTSNLAPNTEIKKALKFNECSNCHASVSIDSNFCKECGSKIESITSTFCKECGSQIEKGSKFCSKCGIKVE